MPETSTAVAALACDMVRTRTLKPLEEGSATVACACPFCGCRTTARSGSPGTFEVIVGCTHYSRVWRVSADRRVRAAFSGTKG